jgi:hypothetical protein
MIECGDDDNEVDAAAGGVSPVGLESRSAPRVGASRVVRSRGAPMSQDGRRRPAALQAVGVNWSRGREALVKGARRQSMLWPFHVCWPHESMIITCKHKETPLRHTS